MSGIPTRAKPAIVGLEALTHAHNGVHKHQAGQRAKPWKVAAVIPCFNRRNDLEKLLLDVSRQDLRDVDNRPISLWCVVVDNASNEPLSSLPRPDNLTIEFVRLGRNSGGSGGFNAGMSQVLSGAGLTGDLGQPDFVWWLDSDARVARKCLREMVKVLARHPKVGGVGSALGDLATGRVWENGAHIIRQHGYILPAGTGDVDKRFLVKADYLAACSGLVRRTAIEKTGLFPNNFIYYDDIDWCIQMTEKTGLKIVGAPKSRAFHPPGDRRYVTWGRYYIARNCFSHCDAMKLGGWVRYKRALRELPRAVGQTMMGLEDLAALHIRGLRDALNRDFRDIEPKDVLKPLGFRPFSQLKEVVETELASIGGRRRLYVHPLLKSRLAGFEDFRKQLRTLSFEWPPTRKIWRHRHLASKVRADLFGAAWRMITGPDAEVAIVPTGWPTSWFRGKVLIQVTTDGLLVRRPTPLRACINAVKTLLMGIVLAVRLGLRGPHVMELPPAPAFRPAKASHGQAATSHHEVAVKDTGGQVGAAACSP